MLLRSVVSGRESGLRARPNEGDRGNMEQPKDWAMKADGTWDHVANTQTIAAMGQYKPGQAPADFFKTPEPFVTTLNFTNVSIYREGMFGLSRVDCRTLTVLTNQKYAQYKDAVRGQYVERGKRKAVSFVLGGCERWLVVLPTGEAIDPDTSLMVDGSGNCVSRYSSCDPRWRSDFEAKLAASGVKPLLTMTPEM